MMSKTNFITCLIGLIVQLAPAHGSDFQSLYNSGKYQEALSALTDPLVDQTDSVDHYFNLGTVYFQLNQPGLAVAYLEKAARMKPYDPDIHHNLQLARSIFGKLIGQERVDPASGLFLKLADQIAQSIPVLEAGALLSILAALFVGFSFLRHRKSRQAHRVFQSKSGFFGCCALFSALLCLGMSFSLRQFPAAVVLSPQVIRSGPGDQFLELSRVETGMKLRAQDTPIQKNPNSPEVWRQVRYSQTSETQGIGWIRASSLLLL